MNTGTKNGIKSLIKTPRDTSIDDVKDESEACWGKDRLVRPTENKAVIKKRASHAMVSNFILNSVTKAEIDELDIHRHAHECFRME